MVLKEEGSGDGSMHRKRRGVVYMAIAICPWDGKNMRKDSTVRWRLWREINEGKKNQDVQVRER